MNKNVKLNLGLMVVSILVVLDAYMAEYIFGLLPCKLCMIQRIPYFMVALIALMNCKNTGRRHIYIMLLIIASGMMVAGYNVAVEAHLVDYDVSSCTDANVSEGGRVDAVLNDILNKHAVPCDVPAFVFLGISLAGWNVITSFLVIVVSIIYMNVNNKRERSNEG